MITVVNETNKQTQDVGQIIGGNFSNILIRQGSKHKIKIGQILAVDEYDKDKKYTTLLQVYDLQYGSQISTQNRELISGFELEDDFSYEVYDNNIRNYVITNAKTILTINHQKNSNLHISTELTKHLPKLLLPVRMVTEDDLKFLTKPNDYLQLGYLNATKAEIPIYLKGDDVLSHHVLVSATTGRGKSNLTKFILYNIAEQNYAGVLVLDPHDEYYGNMHKKGLKDFHKKDKIIYYSDKRIPVGQRKLSINIQSIFPYHFNGVFNWSDPQTEAIYALYKKYGKDWITAILLDKPIDNFNENTIAVVKRRLMSILDLEVSNGQIISNSIFSLDNGVNTLTDIIKELEEGRIVIVNTSSFSGAQELLIGSLIVSSVFNRYKYYKMVDELNNKPVISIVLEEAPRVLSASVLEKGPNVFSTIAREGRKFKVGLYAITQIPSVIPKDILANMNTKIILGMEMKSERNAVIESAAQDLSTMDRAIASLDKGEAIVTSVCNSSQDSII
ncbi:MAG: DUF87 domain-containing protein [Nitrospiraceae bacterium]|nr:DUF87 domain-containing protein [Nitrospiraceae bacterium]